jgi:hypothetical protein
MNYGAPAAGRRRLLSLMEALVDSERSRIAQLKHWHDAWLECAAWVRLRAEERSTA